MVSINKLRTTVKPKTSTSKCHWKIANAIKMQLVAIDWRRLMLFELKFVQIDYGKCFEHCVLKMTTYHIFIYFNSCFV